jgi:hypothetical protein
MRRTAGLRLGPRHLHRRLHPGHMTKGAIAVVAAKVYPEPAKVGCRRGPGGALPQPPGSAPAIGVISARHFSSARRSLARPHAEAAIKAAKC